jgi:excisionase family DNA binding protein
MEKTKTHSARWSFEFLTIHDVGTALKISDRTVRRWISNKDLVAHRLGAQWRIDQRDLDTFLKIRRMA